MGACKPDSTHPEDGIATYDTRIESEDCSDRNVDVFGYHHELHVAVLIAIEDTAEAIASTSHVFCACVNEPKPPVRVRTAALGLLRR